MMYWPRVEPGSKQKCIRVCVCVCVCVFGWGWGEISVHKAKTNKNSKYFFQNKGDMD